MARKTKNSHPVPIVGIGASAGGVEALGGFFKGIDPKPGLGFVIVTHLSPDRESMMHEIVGRYTNMNVHIATDGALVETNNVYVLPPDAVLTIEDGRLQLHKLGPSRRERKPVDVFFSALAKDRGEYSAGVILSGGDGDGTLGVKAIKERGGLTLAQVADGSGPAHPSMPDTAISSGMIDFAVPAEEMGKRLNDFVRGLNLLEDMAGAEKDAEGNRSWADARQEICAILHNRVGHDFRGYKVNTFFRRVQRRMQVNQIALPDAYVALLRQSPVEAGALFRDLLINVTNFFRDAAAFEALASSVIPSLFQGRNAEDTIRIWSPGCATGEEVYSIGILMAEHMATLSDPPHVQIFATDIDSRALGVARAARYPETLLESVSEERRKRFFVADGGTWQVSKEIRDLCIFSPHSVIRDPPFSRMDLVSCRNLLIYFGAEIQKDVIPTFHYSLRPGGYLFLGMSENASHYSDLFTPVDKKHRIFRRRDDAPSRIRIPSTIPGFGYTGGRAIEMANHQPSAAAVRQAIEAQVLDNFAPAYVAVNAEGEVIHYSRRTGKYLEAAEGAPSRHLLSMARKGLGLDLRTVLREAVETGVRAVRRGVGVETEDGRVQLITLSVEPMPGRQEREVTRDAMFLVLFADDGPAMSADEAHVKSAARADDAAVHLERELRETRDRLQALIEEYETSVEELKSSNEELVSVNEEAQSANEELEAGKEEVQSLNEELHTVNTELSAKVDELNDANNDLRNLFESTLVATVFLARDLTIRTFTPAAASIFAIRASDQGRPITDLATRIPLPGLTHDIAHVFSTGEIVERAVDADADADADAGPSYLLRIIPYRSEADAISGVLLTFVDITLLTRSEARAKVLQRSEARQKTLIAELNHRVKNVLAVAISIARRTSAEGRSQDEFQRILVERLTAMSRSYTALSRENWTDVEFRSLLADELAGTAEGRFTAEGPPIRVKPGLAVSLGLVIHELATNAAKYGALSEPNGKVSVTWRTANGQLSIEWRERDGPRVKTPEREGFGLELVRQEMTYNLDGAVEFDFGSSGLGVTLRCPL